MEAETIERSMFGKLEHVGVVVKDIENTVKFLSTLGIGPFVTVGNGHMREVAFRGEVRGKAAEWKLGIGKAIMDDVELELLQPLEGRCVLREHLETVGEGLHHLGFATNDIAGSTDKLIGQGIKVLMRAAGPRGGGFGYFETSLFGGIVVELRQLVP